MVEKPETQETDLFGTLPGSRDSSPAHPVYEPPIPEIPGYQILSMLGRGGMGHVYLARHDALQRQVALKVIAAGATATAEMLRRFRDEARSVAAVRHPGVCQIFATGETGNVPYLAMEYVDGQTLAEAIREQPPHPRKAAQIILTIAQAIEACHQAGIIHRDLKPANVMHSRDGRIKIMDFGLARRLGEEEHRTRTGEIIGTPSYMAPEQASGVVKQFGPECDVYAMGAILYELVTGRPPFYTPDVMQTILQVLTADPIRPRNLLPRVPVDLETICLRCLEKQPRKRYPSAAALAEDLQRFLDGKPILARRTPAWERLWKWVTRHPAWTALIVTGSLAVMTIAAGVTFHIERLQTELNKSERLLNRGLDLGSWLVNNHIPHIARIRGGSTQQAALVEKSLEYLNQLEQDAQGDQQLGEYIAQAYVRIAEMQADPAFATPERAEQALTSYARSLLSFRHLASGDKLPRVLEKVSILVRMSQLNTDLDHSDAARQCADQAVEILSALDVKKQEKAEVHLALLSARFQQLRVQEADGSPEQAFHDTLALFHSAEQLKGAATETARRDLRAQSALRLAEMLDVAPEGIGRETPQTALDFHRVAIQELQWLTEDNPRRAQDLAVATGQLARRLQEQGELEEANELLQRALEQQRTLTREIPESVILQQTLLSLLEQQFLICEQQENSTEALAVAEEHRQIADDMYLSDPLEFRSSLQRSHHLLSIAHQRFPHHDEAVQQMTLAIELARQTAAKSQREEEARGLARMLQQQVELILARDRAASTRADSLRSLEHSIELLDEAATIHQQLDKAPIIPNDSPYWEVLAFKHRLEDQRDRWKIENQEKAVSGPRGRAADFQPPTK